MDSFVTTVIFILPGVLMYFWIQAFGINPAIKHSVPEVAAIAALMWLPVSITTILIYNLIGLIYGAQSIWTLTELQSHTNSLKFLAWFLFISIPVSFLVSFAYARIIYPFQRVITNYSRKKLGLADLASMPTVWEEFFVKVDKNNATLSVRVFKLDKSDEKTLVGVVKNASRPFETERALVLEKCSELKESDDYFEFETTRSYVDIKTGVIVQEINPKKPTKNVDKFN
ncbi:DUF6338 family protein [Paenibacillus sp. S25]|uniref:DUF6338 family protein n=1 Tax=Paenibacillus sp. S25 TaxID=2823905 RepID=UPI001C64CEA2|nr:DUF6338 family protein [Paenibacillus sp. S25]QYK62419.1 hypothetical protein KAI37_02749 [Paenibacillus sp. S25]